MYTRTSLPSVIVPTPHFLLPQFLQMFRIISVVSRALVGLRVSVPPLAVRSSIFAAAQLAPLRTFKTKSAVKKMCSNCYLVKRKGRVFVYCKSNAKHKQRQG